MSLLDLASLVLAPTATKEGKVYSAIPDTGQGDMTFTRGSAATRVNSAGLIEKERANLLLQSNTFNTTWSTINTSVTSGQSGYDGSSDAWLITKSASSARVEQSITQGGVQTYSVYAKAGTLDFVMLNNGVVSQWYDLSNGTIGTNSSISNTIDAKIEDVGNGWYRCSLIFNLSITVVRIYPSQADNDVSGTSGNVYIQDAMLNQGLVAQPYIETTTTAVYEGITDDVPRVDYSGGGCPSLLLEGSRTNLNDQSEYFNGWTKVNATVTDNEIVSPEGVQNGSLVECTSGRIQKNISLTSGTTYVISLFAKANGDYFSVQVLDGTNPATQFNLSTESTSDSNGATSTIEEFGNGWYRCTMKFTSAYTGDTTIRGITSTDIGGVYIYGWQLEAGSYSTSYIPTYGTSTSRSADSCSLTNASNLIGQTEGTLYWEGAFLNSRGTSSPFKVNRVGISDGTDTNRLFISDTTTDNQIQAFVRNATGISFNKTVTITDITDFNKIALKYKANDFALWINGVEVATDTTYNYIPVGLDRIKFEGASGSYDLEGKTKSTIVFPIALTDTQLQELTK